MPGLSSAVALALRGRGIAPEADRISAFVRSRFASPRIATKVQASRSCAGTFSNAQATGWSGLASVAVCVGRYRSVDGKDRGRRHAVCAGLSEDGAKWRLA